MTTTTMTTTSRRFPHRPPWPREKCRRQQSLCFSAVVVLCCHKDTWNGAQTIHEHENLIEVCNGMQAFARMTWTETLKAASIWFFSDR